MCSVGVWLVGSTVGGVCRGCVLLKIIVSLFTLWCPKSQKLKFRTWEKFQCFEIRNDRSNNNFHLPACLLAFHRCYV